MADLFGLEQLASYMQSDLDQASASLARDLATSLIRSAVGAAAFDALTDLTPFLPLALEVARRVLLNPAGSRSESVDDYSVTYAAEFVGGAALTDAERALVRALAGVEPSTAAFTIRPAGVPPGPLPLRSRCGW